MATTLVRAALREARQRRWKIVPRCSYVAGFIERNPEFADLVERQERAWVGSIQPIASPSKNLFPKTAVSVRQFLNTDHYEKSD
jgi:hypothetical protein